jgi:hypothetical protein
METILKIEGAEFELEQKGFIITTNKQRIRLYVDNSECRHEDAGYFLSEDNLDEFINSDLFSVKITDRLLKAHEKFDTDLIYEGDAMFVDLNTSRGVLQFVAYVDHGCYYGHEACVVSSQLTIQKTL